MSDFPDGTNWRDYNPGREGSGNDIGCGCLPIFLALLMMSGIALTRGAVEIAIAVQQFR